MLALPACSPSTTERPTSKFFGDGHQRCSYKNLRDQGFSGELEKGAMIEFIGFIDDRKIRLSVFYYDFNNPESNHGNHRLVLVGMRCSYVGSYVIDNMPIYTKGNKIIFPDTGIPGNVVEFTGGVVPDHIWIDGDVPQLIR
jgi:hypothetical protein